MSATPSHLLDALAAWYSTPSLVALDVRGMPVYPHEYVEAEALAEAGSIYLTKDGSAWYVRPVETEATHAPE